MSSVRLVRWLCVCSVLAGCVMFHGRGPHAHAVTIATIGDSYTDDYGGQGYTHRAWTDQIAANPTGVDFGGAGLPLNYAVRGHTTTNAVSNQRPQLLANLGSADYVVVDIGLNDLHGIASSGGGLYKPFRYIDIGNGNAAVTASTANTIINNITQVIDDIRAADPNKRIILSSIPDWGSTVSFRKPVIDETYDLDFRDIGGKDNVELRRTFTRALKQEINKHLIDYARNNNIPVVNKLRLMAKAEKAPDIAFTPTTRIDTRYHPGYREAEGGAYAMWADGLHPGTAWQGIYANVILGLLRDGFGEDVDLLTAQQIMATYGGGATLPTDDVHRAWSWENYVIMPFGGISLSNGGGGGASMSMSLIPEPASGAVLVASAAALCRRPRREC